MGRRAAAIITILFGSVLGAGHAAACGPPEAMPQTAVIAETRPDGTFRLADGREGKLAGVTLAEGAGAPFRALAAGRPFPLRTVGRPDRWGRQAFHADGLEQMLLRHGLGHAAARAPGACLAPLLRAESEARAAKQGIWARPGHVLSASDGAVLRQRLGHHILAEGKVVSARSFRGRVYLNFARYWKTGLSLIIAEKQWPMFSGNVAAEEIVGKRLRARGWLDWRGGPVIVAGPDERIELAE